MTRQDVLVKRLMYGLLLFGIALLNYQILPQFPIPVPLLLPVLTVAGASLEGAPFGAGYGGVAGCFMATLGGHSLWLIAILALVGWVCGLLAQYVLRQDVWGHILCALLVLVGWEAIQVGGRVLYYGWDTQQLMQVALPEWVCSLVGILPLYALALSCCKRYGRIRYE